MNYCINTTANRLRIVIIFISFLCLYSLAIGASELKKEETHCPKTKGIKSDLSIKKAEPVHLKQDIEPLNLDEMVQEAGHLIKKNDYDAALILLTPAAHLIMSSVKYADIASDFIAILVWKGRYDDAISSYENLPPSFPKRAYLMRNVAKAYSEKKRYDDAAALYEAALEKESADAESQKGLINTFIVKGEYDKALKRLEDFLNKATEEPSLLRIRAFLLFKQGRYVESLKEYQGLGEKGEEIHKLRNDLITSLPEAGKGELLKALRDASDKGDVSARLNYVLTLILTRDHRAAVSVFESEPPDYSKTPKDILSWLGWAYFQAGNINKAKELYNHVLAVSPDYVAANIGLSYCYAAEGISSKALETLDRMIILEPENIEISFARAYAFEKAKMFWAAIQEYDCILDRLPKNPTAMKLRLRAFSDLGASSYALEGSKLRLPADVQLSDDLNADVAADYIQWEEYETAKKMLSEQFRQTKSVRSGYDLIMALFKNEDMEEVVAVYEELERQGVQPRPWVMENAAGAYLYLEQPHKALELYNRALQIDPTSYNGRMGEFYTLQELMRWREAEDILNELDSEKPEFLVNKGIAQPNWQKLEVSLARAWLLAYEGRLEEAEDYFWDLREKAPANMGIRSGLAHVYLWRGWHHKALEEFRIVKTNASEDISAEPGRILALNETALKTEARLEAEELLKKNPRHKHVQSLYRRLQVEDMRELSTDIVFSGDEDGFGEVRFNMSLSQQLSLYTRIYGFLLWQESSDDERTTHYRRAGLGINHIFNSYWRIRQQFSANYNNGRDFGSLSQIFFTPDDYWRFSLSYDTFSTDVPLRARVSGIEADRIGADIEYRESEWRSYRLSLSQLKFSDDNKREQALISYEQGLLIRNNWRMRLFADVYASRNSLNSAPYFNPGHDLSVSATHMTEYTHFRIYNRAFLQRLYMTLGTYKQDNFSSELTGAIRYEHDHNFSDTNSLLYGVTFARQAFDGEPVHSYSLYITYRWRF
ncbi:MAG: tetratricopeptide repeat protein [Nitrospirae bacterium]|nr:tetratricopeptide repeat protein [Nitrospirota bacterium]